MASQDMLRFRRGDWLAVALVLLLALAVLLAYRPQSSQAGAHAEIYQGGQWLRTVSLAEDQVFEIGGAYSNQVEVRQGRIAIVDSDCPGMDCVHIGFVGTPGRSIVCLPNGVEIRVTADEAEVDFVVR